MNNEQREKAREHFHSFVVACKREQISDEHILRFLFNRSKSVLVRWLAEIEDFNLRNTE